MNRCSKQESPVWLLLLLASFPQISETIYSPALPNIANQLHSSNHWVQWTLSIYFIGFAIGIFTWGRCSDRHGRRLMMLIAIIIYMISSLLCLLAKNIDWLLVTRLIQGFGASCGSVLTQAIARESLPEHKRHQFFAMAGFAIAASVALGPLIGGYLTEWINWQANFSLLCLMGLLLLALSYRYLQETHSHSSHRKQKATHVLIRLLKDKYVLACATLVALVNGLLFSYYAEAPFIFINKLGLSASQYGQSSVAIALAAFIGSLLSRKMLHQFEVRQLIFIGCLIMVISSALLLMTTLTLINHIHQQLVAVALILLPMMGLIIGAFGFIIPATLSNALLNYRDMLGTAGAWFGLMYYLLVAAFTWVMGIIHNGSMKPMPIYFAILSLATFIIFLSFIGKNKKISVQAITCQQK